MKKVLFIVPYDYEEVGGMRFPIENYLSALETRFIVTILKIGYRKNKGDRKRARKILNSGYDILLVYGLNQCNNCVDYLSGNKIFENVRKVAHLIDCEYFYAKSVYEKSSWIHLRYKAVCLAKMWIYKKRERRCLNLYDDVLYVSKIDAEYAQQVYSPFKAKIHVVENGVAIPKVESSKATPGERFKIGFISHMSWNIIEENIKPILNELLPKLNMMDAQLVIAGKGMNEAIKELCLPYSNVLYMGYVHSLDDFYDSVDIIISYTKKKNGILNKVLEAWAYGKCVVGIDYNFKAFSKAVDGKHYISGSNAQEIVEQLHKLRNNYEEINRIGDEAKKLVEKEYAWKNQRRLYLEIFK